MAGAKRDDNGDVPVIHDPDFPTLDRSIQERMAQSALLAEGEDPTDPRLVDRVIEVSTKGPVWATTKPSKKGMAGLMGRIKLAAKCTDDEIAEVIGVTRQAVNSWTHARSSRQFTPAERERLVQFFLLQRRRLDAVIEELRLAA